MESAAILSFVAFEVAVFFMSVRLTYLALEWRGAELSGMARIVAWTAGAVVVSSSISGILAFNGLHEPLHYGVVGLAFLLASHAGAPAGIRAYARWLKCALGSIADNLPRWQALAVFSVAAPFLLMVIRPTDETDSLFNLQFMLDWLYGGRDPYWMNAHNPSFWELSYLPSVILGDGDHFFWTTSLKTVLLIGAVNYMLGRKLGIPRNLCWPACLAGCMFFLLWYNPSGLGTIKTDMVFAAGVSLLVYGIVCTAHGHRRPGLIWWTLGAVFVLTKLSGVGVLAVALLILVVFARKKPARLRRGAVYACAAFLVVLGTSGHYYVQSMVEYGNPFYPHSVGVFGVGFQSATDRFSDTSIMSSIGDERLWGYLLEPRNVFAAGILYPAVAAFGIFGTTAIVIYNMAAYAKKRRFDRISVAVSLFLLLTWLIYLFHYGGASHVPGDLAYISTLASLRYVEGTFIITELFLVYALLKARVRPVLIYVVVGINLAAKITYLGSRSLYGGFSNDIAGDLVLRAGYFVARSQDLDYFLPVVPVVAVAFLTLLVYRSKSRLLKATTLSALIMAAFWTAPGVLDQNRQEWLPWYNGSVMHVHYDEPATIYTVRGELVGGGQKLWPLTYPWKGNAFQHDVEVIQLDGILERLESGGPPPDHLVALCNPNEDCESDFREMESAFAGFGYGTSMLDGKSLLMTFPHRAG